MIVTMMIGGNWADPGGGRPVMFRFHKDEMKLLAGDWRNYLFGATLLRHAVAKEVCASTSWYCMYRCIAEYYGQSWMNTNLYRDACKIYKVKLHCATRTNMSTGLYVFLHRIIRLRAPVSLQIRSNHNIPLRAVFQSCAAPVVNIVPLFRDWPFFLPN